MTLPFKLINEWLEKEKSLGSTYPNRLVLATASKNAIPHSRIVAIREITEESLLFFTQKGTRKTLEMKENPTVSSTIWLPLQQREIIIDGEIQELLPEENLKYWNELPREQQLKFSAYSPISSQPINSIKELEERYEALAIQYENSIVPMTMYYCGYRLIPSTFYFYTLGVETFSEVFKFEKINNQWKKQLISP